MASESIALKSCNMAHVIMFHQSRHWKQCLTSMNTDKTHIGDFVKYYWEALGLHSKTLRFIPKRLTYNRGKVSSAAHQYLWVLARKLHLIVFVRWLGLAQNTDYKQQYNTSLTCCWKSTKHYIHWLQHRLWCVILGCVWGEEGKQQLVSHMTYAPNLDYL